MNDVPNETDRWMADVIHQRAGAGENELVAGWQKMLSDLLEKMAPYMIAGRLVTFNTLLPEEKPFFELLHQSVAVPGHAMALFISPSVRHQMMFGNRKMGGSVAAAGNSESPPDAGILLASRADDRQTIVNVLFAYPPHTPAIDVYDRGRLIAGYSYAAIPECREEISFVLKTHLPAGDRPD